MNKAFKSRKILFIFALLLVLLLSLNFVFAQQTLLEQTTPRAAGRSIFQMISDFFKDGLIKWYTPTGMNENRFTYSEEYSAQRVIIDLILFFGLFLSLALLGLNTWIKDGGRAAKGVAIFLALILDFALVFGIHTITKTSVRYTSAITLFMPFAKYFIYIAAFIMVWALLNKMRLFGDGGQFWNLLIALLIVMIAFAGVESAFSWAKFGSKGYEPTKPVIPTKSAQEYINTAEELVTKADTAIGKGDLDVAKRYLDSAETNLRLAKTKNPTRDQGGQIEGLEMLINVLRTKIAEKEKKPEPDPRPIDDTIKPTASNFAIPVFTFAKGNSQRNPHSNVYAILRSNNFAVNGKTISFVDAATGEIKATGITDARGVAYGQITRPASSREVFRVYARYTLEDGTSVTSTPNQRNLQIDPQSGKKTTVTPVPDPTPSKVNCAGFYSQIKAVVENIGITKDAKIKQIGSLYSSFARSCSTDPNFSSYDSKINSVYGKWINAAKNAGHVSQSIGEPDSDSTDLFNQRGEYSIA